VSILYFHNIRLTPIIHRKVTFAEQVRREALAWRPDVIAVELPATLASWIVRGALRLPQISAVVFEEQGAPGELSYLPIDPCDGLIEAVRLACEHGIPLEFIDLDLAGLQEPWRYLPDDTMLDLTGLEPFVDRVAPLVATRPDDRTSLARERHMALRLRELAARHRRVLAVLGLGHFTRVRRLLEADHIDPPAAALGPGDPPIVAQRPDARLVHVSPASLSHLLGEIPYLTWLFEQSREELELTGEVRFDKFAALQTIFKLAEHEYRQRYKETITLTQWKALLQFTRNMALVRGGLRPDLYEIVLGARGVVDGDFGCEVLEIARSYPPQRKNDEALPNFRIRNGRGLLEGRRERFRLRPRQEEPPSELVQLRFRRRPPAELKARWKEQWQRSAGRGICSWPPEDERQERFMDYVRKRALQVVSEDRRQVQEFTTSMLDGLDIRETMRNWHTGKLFVQTTPQPQGKVSAVVLVFQDEPIGELGSWRATLYAENQNESDISFYASPLGENVVGPRIARTEFGGILSIYPALGIPDIWRFELPDEIRTCADALLAAGILFSSERYVAYVAARPPRQVLKRLAEIYRKHIIYMPLHGFSANHLKAIRKFHILDGHDVRQWAADYIFDD